MLKLLDHSVLLLVSLKSKADTEVQLVRFKLVNPYSKLF